MNKLERIQAGKKVTSKRAKALGWKAPFDSLPKQTRIALSSTGSIRVSKRSDRKEFGKTTKKRYYGHFSGRSQKAITKRDLIERAKILDSLTPSNQTI